MRGGGVDQSSDVGEEDFDHSDAAEDIDLGLVDRAVPESKIMLTAVNSSGSPLVVGATMAPGSSCIGPAVTEKTEKVNAVMAEKVKFTVSVRGHQWSSARHVEETLQEFAAVIQAWAFEELKKRFVHIGEDPRHSSGWQNRRVQLDIFMTGFATHFYVAVMNV